VYHKSIPALLAWLAIVAIALAVEPLHGQTLRRRSVQRRAEPRARSGERVTIGMQLGTDRGISPLKVQQWVQLLEPLELRPLSIAPGDPRDQLDVREQSSAGGRHLTIYGFIDSRGRLLAPGHTFTLSDRAAIAEWIDELKRFGPRGSPAGKPLWGLTEGEFRRLYGQLSTPLGRSFEETPMAEVLEHCSRITGVAISDNQRVLPLGSSTAGRRATASPLRRLAASPTPGRPVVTLHDYGLSVGTSLAYLLSQHNRAYRVEPTRDGPPRIVVLPQAACSDPWPIGWPSPKMPSELAPKLMKLTPVELVNAPADQVLDAVEKNAEVPFLYDHAALARSRIDLTQVAVNYVRKRGYWKKILDRAAFVARLDAELKTDEAGKPFVWITTSAQRSTQLRPPSRPARRRVIDERHDAAQENKP
jgi:hypothetical protein